MPRPRKAIRPPPRKLPGKVSKGLKNLSPNMRTVRFISRSFNMAFTVERDWITLAGLRAVVIVVLRDDGSRRHRCGYVRIPEGHPLHKVHYNAQVPTITKELLEAQSIGKCSLILVLTAGCGADDENSIRRSPDILFDVHGGLTYANGLNDYPVKTEGSVWWYGFDCAHAGDRTIDPGLYDFHGPGDVARSREYVEAECESLASQLYLFAKGV